MLKSSQETEVAILTCANKKRRETRVNNRKTKDLEKEKELEDAKAMRLSDFTPRELFTELKRRGYEFKATYVETHTIDSKDF